MASEANVLQRGDGEPVKQTDMIMKGKEFKEHKEQKSAHLTKHMRRRAEIRDEQLNKKFKPAGNKC